MITKYYFFISIPALYIGGLVPVKGEEVAPLTITVHTERFLKQQPRQMASQLGKSSAPLGKHDSSSAPVPPVVKESGNDSNAIQLKFIPMESRIEIFSVEASLKSGERKTFLGIGYEEKFEYDGELGTALFIPEGATLKVSSSSTDQVANGCYVCYSIGTKDAMTFILDSTDLRILQAWRSPIKNTPLASRSSRLVRIGPDKFKWVQVIKK